MASEWARGKVEKIIKLAECIHADDCDGPYGEGPCDCWVSDVRDEIAAALDAARAEGERIGRAAERAEVNAGTALRMRPEMAWLIESRFTPAPTWWTGTDHPAPWTRDSLKAVRFCRKRDAENAMAALQDGHFCFVSEHQWGLGGPMRGPEEEK